MIETKDITSGNFSVSAASISDTVININANGTAISEAEATERENQYLERIKNDCTALKWLRQVRKEDDDANSQGLQSVYTALMTQSVEGERHQLVEHLDSLKAKEVASAAGLLGDENKPQLSALTVLNQCQYLVITGDPGSGKSAFVDYLTLCMAGEALGDEYANLNLLTDPIPDNKGEPLTEEVETEEKDEEGKPKSETREVRQPWDHGALIPVRIILRDFSASDCFPEEKQTADACQVLSFIEASLQSTGCGDYLLILKERLRQGGVLVMFDGLDEVPRAGERRKRLLDCIEGFTRSYAKCRVLVTCRPYAYQDKQWRLEGFADTRLADFNRGQMIRFIRRWYASSHDLDEESRKQRAQKLQNAILNRENLTELAKRPLLLSLIAYLHANRHDLPERRADLYERLLELLVDEWERVRFKADDEEAAREQNQLSLAEFLHIGQDTIRKVLERLAFQAHASQGANQQGTADIAASDLTHALSLEAREAGKKIDPFEISIFLCDRVGILYQRGGANERDAVYTFPHRSFQEYLAAAYFRRDADAVLDYFEKSCAEIELQDESWQYIAAHLGKTDPDRWREVVVLLGGMKSIKDSGPVWDLLDDLIDEGEYTPRQQAWGMRLAAEILAESLDRSNVKRSKKKRIFETIQKTLPELLGTTGLPARERAAIGNHLAEIGDPRLEITDVDAMSFCFVPKGEFWMGRLEKDGDAPQGLEESPAGLYDLSYDYWMSQHPVSVAQFRAFVEAEKIDFEYPYYLWQPDNTAMVAITQVEAVQFCEWLTKRWQADGKLSEHWQVTLPNEPEWEKAARGGTQVLSEPLIYSAKDHCFDNSEIVSAMQANENPQRVYACGDEISDEQVNFDKNIGSVSASGVYPLGASPYGCHDLTGNVWEWTRTQRNEYPYPAVGTQAWNDLEAQELSACVLRGGAFDFSQDLVRCAIRFNLRPVNRDYSIGFRVILSPLL